MSTYNSIFFDSCRAFNIPYYIGMVVPFLIIYLFNWVVFFIIVVSLLRKNFQSNIKSKKDTKMLYIYRQLVIAITLSVLFGLGWGIGLFATQDIHTNKIARDMFAALFVIITAFHGLFIFIMQCLRSKDVRNSWKRCFFDVTGKRICEFTSAILPCKHKKQVQAMKKSVQTTKLTDTTKELSVFGHGDIILEKHSIDKANDIQNQFEEEKVAPPILLAMENINTDEKIKVDEELADTSLTKSMSNEAKQCQYDEETIVADTDQ